MIYSEDNGFEDCSLDRAETAVEPAAEPSMAG